MKLAKVGALVAPAAHVMVTHDTWERKIDGLAIRYLGYSTMAGAWTLNRIWEGWGPFVAVTLITTLAQKLSGIVRRL
jgi:hypothetical protein